MALDVTGAFKAIKHKSDIVRIVIPATIIGIAAGVIRDACLGKFPPNVLVNPLYCIVTISIGILIFFLYPSLRRYLNLFLKFDVVGLGVFTVIGATIAYNMFGLNFLAIAFGGVLTAIGGSILRQVSVNEIPIVSVKELYASTSFMVIVIFL